MIMDGVGEPYLILDRTASPHRYSLSPKKAKQIEEADIIFWDIQELDEIPYWFDSSFTKIRKVMKDGKLL